MSARFARRWAIGPFLLVMAMASRAEANGRYPLANHLVQDPIDPSHLVVRTTYGLVETSDHGKTWSWVCESLIGYSGSIDPPVDLTHTGRLLIGLFDELATSTDRGCTFPRSGSLLKKEFVIDLVVVKDHAYALTSTGLGDPGFHVIVAESTDGGGTWTKAGVDLPLDFNSETLEVAPSRLDRIYASGIVGVSPRVGALEKSDDHGKTWERLTIDLAGAKAPYLAAVDPSDPDTLYVRIDGDPSTAMPDKIADRLIVSHDGGKTWKDIAGSVPDMLGFALSPDGKKVAYGTPPDRFGHDGGLWVASTSDYAFERVSPIQVRCLKWTREGLFACAAEVPDNFTVGLSKDDGKTFAPLHHLSEVSPLSCAYGACQKSWEGTVRDTLGIDAGPPSSDDAGTSEPPTVTSAAPSKGCGCSFAGSTLGGGVCALAFAALCLTRRRAR